MGWHDGVALMRPYLNGELLRPTAPPPEDDVFEVAVDGGTIEWLCLQAAGVQHFAFVTAAGLRKGVGKFVELVVPFRQQLTKLSGRRKLRVRVSTSAAKAARVLCDVLLRRCVLCFVVLRFCGGCVLCCRCAVLCCSGALNQPRQHANTHTHTHAVCLGRAARLGRCARGRAHRQPYALLGGQSVDQRLRQAAAFGAEEEDVVFAVRHGGIASLAACCYGEYTLSGEMGFAGAPVFVNGDIGEFAVIHAGAL